MTDDDHRKLAEVLRGIEGMAVVSGYPSPLYDELYRDWQLVTRQARKEGGAPSVECLWLSPSVSSQIQRTLF